MKKVVVTILGEDRPGIVHAVSKVLYDQGCNILEASQTILQTEFAGIFIVSVPDGLSCESLLSALKTGLTDFDLTLSTKPLKPIETRQMSEAEPYVLTLRGQDRPGIIPGVSGVVAGFDANIVNLKAIPRQDDPTSVMIVFEVDVPNSVSMSAFRGALGLKSEELGMEVSVQHRDIFEAIHRL